MRWMDDCIQYDNYLKNETPREVIIIGGGYVGLGGFIFSSKLEQNLEEKGIKENYQHCCGRNKE